MIKAKATIDGRETVILGLSFGNLRKFLAAPGDTFIRIDRKEMGLPHDILIFSCETEAQGAKHLERGIGPHTTIHAETGPTGDFPRGKLNDSDEGGLTFAIGLDPDRKTVIIDFGKPTKWIGLDKQTALALVESLKKHAQDI